MSGARPERALAQAPAHKATDLVRSYRRRRPQSPRWTDEYASAELYRIRRKVAKWRRR